MSVNIIIEAGDDYLFAPAIARLPARIEIPRRKASPAALVFIPVFLFFFYQLLLAISPAVATSGILVVGAGVLVASWQWWRSSGLPHVLSFDRDGVAVSERRTFGTRHWQANYAEFEGVLLRSILARTGRASFATYEIIELKHADPDRTLPLYAARSRNKEPRQEPRERWRSLAALFGVPALDGGEREAG